MRAAFIVRGVVCPLLLIIVGLPLGTSQSEATNSQAVENEIQNGVLALEQRRYSDAKEHFEQAEKLAGTASAQINAGLAISELQLGHFDVARQREAKVLQTVTVDHARAEAYNIIGMSWLRESSQNVSAEMLRSAEDSFRQALLLDPWFDSAYFNLGETLLRENRNDEAPAVFKKFTEAAARSITNGADFPLKPQHPAPDYKVTNSEGSIFSSQLLRGRFVLLDFWATWCPPCIRALPAMRELAHYFPPEQLTVISVDEDSSDEALWRRFISAQKMNWVQAWDKGSMTYSSFGVAPPNNLSLPRYVFLDRGNSVLHVYSGTDRLGMVMGQIVRTVEAAASDAPAVDSSTAKQAH